MSSSDGGSQEGTPWFGCWSGCPLPWFPSAWNLGSWRDLLFLLQLSDQMFAQHAWRGPPTCQVFGGGGSEEVTVFAF